MSTLTRLPLLVATLCLSATGSCWAEETKAQFVDPPKQVEGDKAEVQVQVPRAHFDGADVWVGVVPFAAADTIWLQGAGVDTPEHTEIIYLGRPIKEDAGKYQVRIVSFPKGTTKEAGPVKVSGAKKMGMKTLASVTIQRTE